MKTHGHSVGYKPTQIYSVHRGMLQRCYNPNNKCYYLYGGRGIKVCKRWRKFENFLADMGPTWRQGLSIDRKNGGDYKPGECRWATPVEQATNRRATVIIEYKGIRMSASQWARRIGRSDTNILWRLHKGYPIERVLEEPKKPLKQVAADNGVDYHALYHQIVTRVKTLQVALDTIRNRR